MKKLLAILLTSLTVLTAQAQWSPGNETIQTIIPFAPGGGTDLAFRHFQTWAEKRGIKLTPIYKGGADGLIGQNDLASAKTDGLTLGFGTVATAAVHKVKNPNYNFEMITVIRGSIMTMITQPNSKINNVEDLERLVRDQSVRATFGYGSPSQKAIWETFLTLAKAHDNHVLVPYKGGAPAMQDAMGGHVDFVIIPYSVARTNIEGGKLKMIAVSIRNPWQEVSSWPNLNKRYPSWANEDGFLASLPQGTNPEAVKFWRNLFSEYLNDPKVLQDFVKEYTEAEPFGSQYAEQRVNNSAKKYARDSK